MHASRCHSTSLALVDLYINGQLTQIHLASAVLPCAFDLRIPSRAYGKQARRYNDYVELCFSLHVRECTGTAQNLYLTLRFPWGTKHYLGPLVPDAVVPSARLLRDAPTSVTLMVDVDQCIPAELTAPLPCEMLLKEHVKTVLENDEFCGSVAAAHMQNLVRDLPFYEEAMQRYRNWSDYVTAFAAFYHCWDVVQYDEKEHARLQLSGFTPAAELRLVANCYANRHVPGDVQRDRIKNRAMRDFRDQVLLRPGELYFTTVTTRCTTETQLRLSRNAVRHLQKNRSFCTLNTVNYLHVLGALMNKRCILFSPLHPVQVDRCVQCEPGPVHEARIDFLERPCCRTAISVMGDSA